MTVHPKATVHPTVTVHPRMKVYPRRMVHPGMTMKLSPWTAVRPRVSMVTVPLWYYQRRALLQMLPNSLLLQAKSPRTRAPRTNRREKGAKRGRMAGSGALASTPQPLPGHLRGTPSENHQGTHAHDLENVTAARPLVARPELAAEKETGTGRVRETILGGNVVARGEGGDPGVALGPGHVLGLGLDHDPEQDHTDEGPARNGQPPESSLPRGRSAGEAGGPGRGVGLVVRDGGITEALAALKMVCLQKVPLNARPGQKIQTGL